MYKNYKPIKIGSYSLDDVVFLLKDVSNLIVEQGTEEREDVIQGGGHYSEMLPIEYKPSEKYIELFHSSLRFNSLKIAEAVALVSEKIIAKNGTNIVLVSLARAGTPFGILIKRYIKYKFKKDIPHYSISIIRGKGIDENALKYILNKHGNTIQFIDGWTGKGAINNVLKNACIEFEKKNGLKINDTLAVIADPGYCCEIYGTREDFLLPSACLNSTVSGLISRTVLRKDLINEDDFHGVKVYDDLIEEDFSNYYLDYISKEYSSINNIFELKMSSPSFLGSEDVNNIKKEYNIEDINMVKPGIGETTRVLLRRIPWKILVKNMESPSIEHILLLAKEKNVEVLEYPFLSYECCGIVKSVKE